MAIKKASATPTPKTANLFVRGGMFSVKSFRNIDRPQVDFEIFSNPTAKSSIRYDGPELNWQDYQVYAALLKIQRSSGLELGVAISVPASSILEQMGVSRGGLNYGSLWEAMRRLRRGSVGISQAGTLHESSMVLSMQKDGASHLGFSLSAEVSKLFDDECAYVELAQISSLKTMMAKWLYAYFRSPNMPARHAIADIRSMMRVSERTISKEFNRNLRLSLGEVSEMPHSPFTGWLIDGEEMAVIRPQSSPTSHMDAQEVE